MHPAAVDLTKVQCTTQSFSVHVDVILYKQNWEFKKVETEKKRLTNEPPLPLYRKRNILLKPQRQTHVGVTDVLLVLQLFLCFTSLQAKRFTTYVQVSSAYLTVSGQEFPFPSRLIQFLLSVSFTSLLLHHGRVPPSKVLHSHDHHSSYL